MKDTRGSNAWRFWGAIFLVLLLILLWLFGYGPSNTCCSDLNMSDLQAAAPATISETPITINFKDSRLTLSGEVGSDEAFKQSLLDAADKAVGVANVIDDITVNTDANEHDVVLTRVVPAEAEKENIDNAFEAIDAFGDVHNQLTVLAVTPVT